MNCCNPWSNRTSQCSCQMGCGCQSGWQNSSSCCGCPRPRPIVMPTQVCVQRRVTPQEQPVILPIERRTVNQCCYYPRVYPVYQNTFYTQF